MRYTSDKNLKPLYFFRIPTILVLFQGPNTGAQSGYGYSAGYYAVYPYQGPGMVDARTMTR